MKLSLLFLLTIFLVACESQPIYKSASGSVTQHSKTERTCWHLPRPTGATTFLLVTGANVGKLSMTDEDVQAFTETMAKRYKVPQAAQCVLEDVYKQELEQALIDLAALVQPDDVVFAYFSGHGAQIDDDNRDEGSKDSVDEVLVTMDATDPEYPDSPNVIRDDRFVQLVNALPTSKVVTILDSCYSGGMDKAASDKLLAHATIKQYPMLSSLGLPPSYKQQDRNGFHQLKGVLLTAAGEHEFAREYSAESVTFLSQIWQRLGLAKVRGGLFTSALVQELAEKADVNLQTAFQEARRLVVKTTRSSEAPQKPQVVGDVGLMEIL